MASVETGETRYGRASKQGTIVNANAGIVKRTPLAVAQLYMFLSPQAATYFIAHTSLRKYVVCFQVYCTPGLTPPYNEGNIALVLEVHGGQALRSRPNGETSGRP